MARGPSGSFARLNDELIAEIASELNVGSVESFASAGDVVDFSAKGNFRALGKRFGKETPRVAQAIADADAAALAAALVADGEASVGDGAYVVTADEVIVSERPREGWSVVNEQGETVALDLTITPELARAGLAREVVRTVQEARKASGLQVSDRIRVQWAAAGDLAEAITEHSALIADEVLAVEWGSGTPDAEWTNDGDLGLSFRIAKA